MDTKNLVKNLIVVIVLLVVVMLVYKSLTQQGANEMPGDVPAPTAMEMQPAPVLEAIPAQIGEGLEKAGEAVQEAGEAVADKAQEVGEKAQEAVEGAVEAVKPAEGNADALEELRKMEEPKAP